MIIMKARMIFVGFILTVFTKYVQCQMQGMMSMMTAIPNMVNGMRESQARAQLTPIVKYVVGDTATPSPEMVNFAVIAGSAPVTQAEKDAYLDMMKRVARVTPEVLVKFVKDKNGTYKLDEFALDAHITQRAMQYSAASTAKKERKLKEREMKRQRELEMLRLQQDHELKLIGVMTPNDPNAGMMGTGADVGFFGPDPGVAYDVFGTGVDPWMTSGINHPVPEPANPVPAQNNNASPSSTNFGLTNNVSLLDLLRMHETNLNNQPAGQKPGTTPQVTTPAPTQAVPMVPTANPDLLNMMMFNGGFAGF